MKTCFWILADFYVYILPCNSGDLSLKNLRIEVKFSTEKSTHQNYTSTNISAGLSIKELFYEYNVSHVQYYPGWCGTYWEEVDSGKYYFLKKSNVKFLNLGLNLKKYNCQQNEYDYTFQLISYEILKRSLVSNEYFDIKIVNLERGVYLDFDIEYFKALYGYGFNIYNSKDGYFIPNINGGISYSSLQFDRRSSGNISKFAGITLEGADLNFGIFLPFRYKNLELKLQNKIRYITSRIVYPYIFENNLKIGYNFLTEETNIENGYSKTKFQFPVAISADFRYDIIKIEENIQPQPSVSVNLEFDPVFLLSIF